jgi:hypothetical protein
LRQVTSVGRVRPATDERDTLATRAAAGLRRHWLGAALLAAGLALRVLAEVSYRPALFYIDSQRYLTNSDGMDPVGYKGPLRVIALLGTFAAVPAVQHLLGLAIAVAIYLILLRRGVSRWLGALAIAPVLLDAYQLQIEQTVMPDTWFEALIVAGIVILLWRPVTSWRAVVAGGLALGTSAIVAQVGEALIVPAVIYVLLMAGGRRRAAGQAAVLCAAFAVPILAYCTGSYLLTGDFFLSHTGVTSLYGRTAAAADCATLRLPSDERGLCPTWAQQVRGPDWLEYNQRSPVTPYYAHLPRGEVDAMISSFNHAVLAQQPGRVLRAYGDDVLKLYMVTRVTGPGDTPITRWQFQTSFPYYPPHASVTAVAGLIGRFGGGGTPTVWRPGASFLRSYQLDHGYTPGPLLVLLTLAGLAGSVAVARRRADPRTRQLGRACLLFFAAAVFVTLVSDLFEFSWRYQLPAIVILPPAGVLGITVIVSAVRSRRGGVANPPAAAPPD